ncbi:MAG: hypothetical protein C4583_01315 [Anaerolineaceae bacterium]|nr:MAG: hypothetical protein C4583_01315 [Anaerolineaceae bacterium]
MDEANLIVLAFVLILMAAVIGFTYFRSRAHENRLALQAEKRGGKFEKSGLLKQARIQIPYKEWQVVIYSTPGSRYSPPKTIAQVKVDSPRLPVIQLERNYLLQKILAAFGRERLLTGDDDFDRRWLVRAADTLTIHKLVTPELKAKLEERILRSLVMRIQPLELLLTIATIPSSEEEYDIFIETTMLVLRKFL